MTWAKWMWGVPSGKGLCMFLLWLCGLALALAPCRAMAEPAPEAEAEAEAEANSCVECHQLAETARRFPPWQQDQYVHWYGSVHGQAGVTCDQCHGGNPLAPRKARAHWGVKSARKRGSPLYYKNVPQTCGKCHTDVYDQFAESRHYKELISDKLAPSCNTCHGFAMDVHAVTPTQILSQCALCHEPERGVKPEVVAEARRTLKAMSDAKMGLQEAWLTLNIVRGQGRNTEEAAALLRSADKRLGSTGAYWHSFRLHGFNAELARIDAQVNEAHALLTDVMPTD